MKIRDHSAELCQGNSMLRSIAFQIRARCAEALAGRPNAAVHGDVSACDYDGWRNWSLPMALGCYFKAEVIGSENVLDGHPIQGHIATSAVLVPFPDGEPDEVCARVADLPNFQAPWWDRDEHGNRINRFRDGLKADQSEKRSFLNELTMRRFEQLCEVVGLAVDKRTLSKVQGPLLVRVASSLMIRIPGVREFFTANAGHILSRRLA